MKEIENIRIRHDKYKEFIRKVLIKNYFTDAEENSDNRIDNHRYDLRMKKGKVVYDIEVLYSSSGKLGFSRLDQVAKSYVIPRHENGNLIIVSNSQYREIGNISLKSYPCNIFYLNLIDILYIICQDEELISEISTLLDFSIENLLPLTQIDEEYNQKLVQLKLQQLPKKKVEADSYLNKIREWNNNELFGSEHAKEYEKLCCEILKYLFNDELAYWAEQKKSNDNLYIFDLICRIKDNTDSEFWNMLERFFNTKYIIFEFKNYTNKISQREIYTTDKYLYEKALRKVAIIVTTNGVDDNAQKAIAGTLRENGKLILVLTNNDLIKMIKIKDNHEYPSDYLQEKADQLLVSLEK